MKDSRMNKQFAFTSLLIFLSLFITGCYMPRDFDAFLQIDKYGRMQFDYDGRLMSVNLLKKIGNKELENQADYEAAVDAQIRDLRRSSGFSLIQHHRDADFLVKYSYQQNLITNPNYIFITRASRLFKIVRNNKDQVSISSIRPNKKYLQELQDNGFTTTGTIRVKTNAKILSQDADSVEQTDDQATILTWNIDSLIDDKAKIILQLGE